MCVAMAKGTYKSSRAMSGHNTALRAILQVHIPHILFFSTLITGLDGENLKMMSGLVLFMDVYSPCVRILHICTIELSSLEMSKLH